ncbi:hypothetical protein EVAR_51249_1 [Eumeta japonica]|uniref:Uncharacterized protein n=1 Tax=Eumeta variegata TaxID=151549 RepID=A0A4C1X339_EUMVA|nr:hypothetical protein EVAR_51249_1 [Eumeta japonica]
MVGHVPVCFDHTAHSIDVFVIHSGGRTTVTKFVTEIDTTMLEFCKPVINSRLAWCFIPKNGSKSSELYYSVMAGHSPRACPSQAAGERGNNSVCREFRFDNEMTQL